MEVPIVSVWDTRSTSKHHGWASLEEEAGILTLDRSHTERRKILKFHFGFNQMLITGAEHGSPRSSSFQMIGMIKKSEFRSKFLSFKELIERAYEKDNREGWVECQPYFTRVLLEALSLHDRRDLALKVIEERWGWRFRDRGWDTCLEEWTTNGSWRAGHWSAFQRTTSHAWSARASEFFIRRMSGIELLEPGGRRISLKPYCGDFAYRLCVPLKHGEVTVNYQPGKSPEIKGSEEIDIVINRD